MGLPSKAGSLQLLTSLVDEVQAVSIKSDKVISVNLNVGTIVFIFSSGCFQIVAIMPIGSV